MGLFDKIKNKAKDKAKNKIKQMIMNIIKVFLIKAGISLLIVVTTIISLASFWYILKKDTIKQTSGIIREQGENGEQSTVNIDDDEREYVLDEEFEKRLEMVVDDLAINVDSVGLTQELLREMYIAEIMTSFPDLRKRDKVGSEIPQGEIQGCIQFKRNYSDGTQEILEYMEFDKFRTELAKFGYDLQDIDGNSVTQEQIYFSKSEVNQGYKELKRYFTLDEEKNVIIATLSSNEVITTHSDYAKEEEQEDSYSYEHYIQVKKVNYQTAVSKYAMPLEFILTMLTISENPGFCEAIINLVKDSKIVIEVQDNLAKTNSIEKYDYVGNFELKKKINYSITYIQPSNDGQYGSPYSGGQSGGTSSSGSRQSSYGYGNTGNSSTSSNVITIRDDVTFSETYTKEKDMMNSPYRKVETNIENMTVNLCVTEAKTWLMDCTVQYEKTEQPTNTNNVTNIADDTEYVEVEDYHDLLKTVEEELPEDAVETSRQESIKERKTEKELRVDTNFTTITYQKVSTNVEEKEEKFLSLLSVDPSTNVFNKNDISKNTKLIKYEDLYGRDTSPEENIFISSQMLFEFLASNQKSEPFEETMRYLLYIYTGKSFGVTTLDFSIYEPSDFNTITATSSLNKFKEYLHSWEGCTSLNEDGTMYKIEIDGGGNPTVGHGIDINANRQTIINAGYSTNTGDYIPKEFVDALEDEIISRNIETVKAKTSGLDLTQYQIYALVSRMYNCGESGAFGVRNGKTFVQAYNAYWNQEVDAQYKVTPDITMYEHSLYTQYMCKPTTSNGEELPGLIARRKSEWILFKTGYFDRTNQYCSELSGSAGTILEAAEAIHYYMEQNNYSYCLIGAESNSHAGECGLDATFEQSKTNHQLTCCATYVSWVLREAGYIDVTHHGSSNLANYLISKGFIQVNYSEMQAGDIIFMVRDGGGHTQIYAGDGQWYNAGSENAIRRSSPYSSTVDSSRITYVLRAP